MTFTSILTPNQHDGSGEEKALPSHLDIQDRAQIVLEYNRGMEVPLNPNQVRNREYQFEEENIINGLTGLLTNNGLSPVDETGDVKIQFVNLYDDTERTPLRSQVNAFRELVDSALAGKIIAAPINNDYHYRSLTMKLINDSLHLFFHDSKNLPSCERRLEILEKIVADSRRPEIKGYQIHRINQHINQQEDSTSCGAHTNASTVTMCKILYDMVPNHSTEIDVNKIVDEMSKQICNFTYQDQPLRDAQYQVIEEYYPNPESKRLDNVAPETRISCNGKYNSSNEPKGEHQDTGRPMSSGANKQDCYTAEQNNNKPIYIEAWDGNFVNYTIGSIITLFVCIGGYLSYNFASIKSFLTSEIKITQNNEKLETNNNDIDYVHNEILGEDSSYQYSDQQIEI